MIQQTLQGILRAQNISNDIIVFGSDQESHDKNLDRTLLHLESKGLTLNREKCIFSVPELDFFGFKISANGISPDDKVEAVRNARPPTTAAEVQSFLGLVNYCARFIPNFSTLAKIGWKAKIKRRGGKNGTCTNVTSHRSHVGRPMIFIR